MKPPPYRAALGRAAYFGRATRDRFRSFTNYQLWAGRSTDDSLFTDYRLLKSVLPFLHDSPPLFSAKNGCRRGGAGGAWRCRFPWPVAGGFGRGGGARSGDGAVSPGHRADRAIARGRTANSGAGGSSRA